MKVKIIFNDEVFKEDTNLDYIPMVGDMFSYQDNQYCVDGDVIKRRVYVEDTNSKKETTVTIWVVEF